MSDSLTAYITNAGMGIINALVTTGSGLKVTRAEIGEGVVTSESEARSLTSLLNKIANADLAKLRRDDDWNVITVQVSNSAFADEFYVNEIGIYCENPSDPGQEVMFYYATFGDNPDWIAPNSVAQYTRMYDFGISIGLIETINVKISPDALVTHEELDGRLKNVEITVDNEVTIDGENAVSGAAVYAFVNEGLEGKADADHNHSALYYNATIKRDANTVLAAPNGSSGEATFRKLVAADIPSLAASKIAAGTLAGKVQANAAAAAVVSTPQLRDIVMTATDPGAGATVDYPDGTVIHVYE